MYSKIKAMADRTQEQRRNEMAADLGVLSSGGLVTWPSMKAFLEKMGFSSEEISVQEGKMRHMYPYLFKSIPGASPSVQEQKELNFAQKDALRLLAEEEEAKKIRSVDEEAAKTNKVESDGQTK